ncbi:hypothetical protein J4730_00945 [Klebsiella pneumoniae]|uniref:Uncharacterized protein n=1 Tax=Klebsiella pneumoniae TaxID=573 RepID=A0A939NRS1_KLEPN|nr:hypothetical protein [Klebsiella pneumoniae]
MFNESLTANDPDFLASSELLIVTLKARQVSNAVKHCRDPAGHHANFAGT